MEEKLVQMEGTDSTTGQNPANECSDAKHDQHQNTSPNDQTDTDLIIQSAQINYQSRLKNYFTRYHGSHSNPKQTDLEKETTSCPAELPQRQVAPDEQMESDE